MVDQLQGKLRSKKDFYTYMDKHRKYSCLLCLHPLSIVLPTTREPGQQGLPQRCLHWQEAAAQEEVDWLHPCTTLWRALIKTPLVRPERWLQLQRLLPRQVCWPEGACSRVLLQHLEHSLPSVSVEHHEPRCRTKVHCCWRGNQVVVNQGDWWVAGGLKTATFQIS